MDYSHHLYLLLHAMYTPLNLTLTGNNFECLFTNSFKLNVAFSLG